MSATDERGGAARGRAPGAAATARRVLHVVLPGDVADPGSPSGGNVYDRRLCQGLSAAGWRVHEIVATGAWPRPEPAARQALARELAALPDGADVLLDGLVACGVPEVVVPHARRLRVAVLVHLPLAAETGTPPAVAARLDARERETLRAASAVVTTSPWAAGEVIRRHGLDPRRVHVAPPGVDPAPLATGTDGASRLLCVAAVTPRKGQDLLVEALATLADARWTCLLAGPLWRAPEFVADLRRRLRRYGLTDRVRLTGPRTGDRLSRAYATADLLVLPSRAETYGMVVSEALARGIPVLATAVDAVPETLGRTADGALPGLLVPPEDPAALAGALRDWFARPALRRRLRAAARDRRAALPGWDTTVSRLVEVLSGRPAVAS